MPRLYVAHRAQALARELAIRLEFKPQSRPLRFEPDSRLFLTISSNCSRSAMGESQKQGALRASFQAPPAKKSAQIISKQ